MKVPGLSIARALPFVLAATLASCALFGGGAGEIKVSEVAPLVEDIAGRHDLYVNADTALTAAAVAQFLSESLHLCDLVGEDAPKYIHVDVLAPAATPIMVRYDAYVAGDSTLTAQKRTALLRSTTILRDVFVAARAE